MANRPMPTNSWPNSAGAFLIIPPARADMNSDTPSGALPDSKPVPPNPDDYGGCCDSGCTPCVYDLYWEAHARYQIALAEWQASQQKYI